MVNTVSEIIPKPGEWPVDPQDDVAISKDRIWIDGCFDFSHHGRYCVSLLFNNNPPKGGLIPVLGHAGAMLQARRLGQQLLVGIHSDQDILDNKGPTVMTLAERFVCHAGCCDS